MTSRAPRLLVDASVVVKSKLTLGAHASEAKVMLQHWQDGAISICVPDQLLAEVTSALHHACRGLSPRLRQDEARTALHQILSLAFVVFKTTGRKLLERAFEIAVRHNQRVYDCIYVALAEGTRLDF